MRLLTLIFLAWMCAVVNASAHQSGAKHCENLNADTHSNECSSERRISSKWSMIWAFDEIDNDDSGDVLMASLDSIDHVACGERTGHLKLVFICSKGTTKVFVTGTCRFADHARFGQLYFKIGEKRRKQVKANVHDGGNALGTSDQKMRPISSTRLLRQRRSQFRCSRSPGCQQMRYSFRINMKLTLMKYARCVCIKDI